MSTPERPGAQKWVPDGVGIDGLAAAAGTVTAVSCTRTRRRPSSVPAHRPPVSCWSVSNPETRRTGRARRSSDRLARSSIARSKRPALTGREAYVTNAVKHFRFTQSGPGKRRIHQTPDLAHLVACKPWLEAELIVLDPEMLIALGATAR